MRVRQRKRKDSEEDSNETDRDTLTIADRDAPEVDLFQLQINTLRRYKRHYKVPTRQGLNKAQLAEVTSIQVLLHQGHVILHQLRTVFWGF